MDDFYIQLKSLQLVKASDIINQNINQNKDALENIKAISHAINYFKNSIKNLCHEQKPDGWSTIMFQEPISALIGFTDVLKRVNFERIGNKLIYNKKHVSQNDVDNARKIIQEFSVLLKLLESCLKDHVKIIDEFNKLKKRNRCNECVDLVEKYCVTCENYYCNFHCGEYHDLNDLNDHQISSVQAHNSDKLEKIEEAFNELFESISNSKQRNDLSIYTLEALWKTCESKCNRIHKPNSRFCGQCGKLVLNTPTKNEFICPSCNRDCKKAVNFCPGCQYDFRTPEKAENILIVNPTLPKVVIDSNSKECPQCTFICEITKNFCPACDYYFKNDEKKIIKEAFAAGNAVKEDVKLIKRAPNDLDKKIGNNSQELVDRLKNLELTDKSLLENEAQLVNVITNKINVQENAIKQESKTKMKLFQERLNNLKEKNRENIEKLRKANSDDELIANKIAENLFQNLMDKVKDIIKKTAEEDMNGVIQNLARVLLANLYSLSALIGKQKEFEKISLLNCEMFLEVFRKKYNDYDLRLEDAIVIIKNNDNPESMEMYMNVECAVCTDIKPMSQILKLNCNCNLCIDCFKRAYEIAIRDPTYDFSCYQCHEPNPITSDKEVFKAHLELLNWTINNNMDNELKERFGNRLSETTYTKEKNFIWCSYGCGSGVLAAKYYETHLKVKCAVCNKHTCYNCRKRWEQIHENKTCDEVEVDEATNGIEMISCSQCKTKFALDKGGCMHYICSICKFEFCGCCKNQMSDKKMDYCKNYPCNFTKLHGHHPPNCFYYIRDSSVDELANHLLLNGKPFGAEAQPNLKTCQLMVTDKESKKDIICNKAVFAFNNSTYGLCDEHLRLHLYIRLMQEKVNILHLRDSNGLKIIVTRTKVALPPEIDLIADENEKKRQLIDFITQNIPMPDLSNNRF